LTSTSEFVKQIAGFTVRPSQIAMAAFVEEAIAKSCNALIEAGTGTGKTYAYLLPSLSSGKKIIVSTGTKNLQDQLFYQDLPLVNGQYHYKLAILKGRSNYLCPMRLNNNLLSIASENNKSVLAELVNVRDWSLRSKAGDLTELIDISQNSTLLPLVSSTADNCLARECDYFNECPVYRARDRAKEAQLVVVNHHLLLSDLILEEEKSMSLLPDADIVIIDEAHQLADIARQFFGDNLSTNQFVDLIKDVKREQLILGGDDPELMGSLSTLSEMLSRFVNLVLASEDDLGALLIQQRVQELVEDFDLSLGELAHRLRLVEGRSPGLSNCTKRAHRLIDLFTQMTEVHSDGRNFAHWIERREKSFSLYLTPLDVARELETVFSVSDRSWIFVSATLTIEDSFEHVKSKLGLVDIMEGKFESPFNYLKQVSAYVPKDLPTAGNDLHTKKLLEAVLPLIRINEGRTFFLFTSNRALRLSAELLANEYDITYLVQGSLPKQQLLEKFAQLNRCVLLATNSFWEGVDVRGADLRCLIIDKLPFASPGNPLVSAQLQAIELNGGNGFFDHSLPETVIALKQGFGRLIREESDQGLFVLGDNRINKRSYGKLLINSLPKMNWITSPEEALNYLAQLEK
ncbi:MAG: ATP-dependent DNA helicase DinG, partial [Candidatus Azotimanducaceae bacterium]